MKIRNTHKVVVEIFCDRCRQPLHKDKHGYYVGALITTIPDMTCKDLCKDCANYIIFTETNH